ncbi:unnamed protein product [Acanthosepion pharaonis]|uniref:TIR domain-containing protein n=1 Tax=Acanthosepion pharaonis TaxID=158019 RepID=A0A812CWE9_ACAPH|nr:unnamed protein product [Sepia pharaonis]
MKKASTCQETKKKKKEKLFLTDAGSFCTLNAEKVMCKCDDEWTGDTCNIPCKKNCTQGKCVIFLGNETCQCPNGFTSESNCTEKKPKSEVDDSKNDMFTSPIIIFLFVLPVVLLLVTALLIYVIWRKRVIFVMKIIYYLQKYEDTDGKLYDAFISFRSSKIDEFWVLQTLFPKLENEMGFKICVHFRDFLVGETISNNIIDAIEKSRRTILVVSPDYNSKQTLSLLLPIYLSGRLLVNYFTQF